ncbi:hypothetical protein MOO44_01855 [Nicoliella spurrieriana]|uniref:Citrate transporter-like domain-containing protein n=1 Tax=Nicoliella spurrieriana TaxID=2925830 RepID=A0A976RS94_9LACO|nr:hypothetical protein MOO44_01855 [Nicoliella spurrieriana]
MINQLKKILTDKLFLISLGVLILVNFIGHMQPADIDWATIGTLFALMVVVQLMNHLNILISISDHLIKMVDNGRRFAQLMIVIAFLGAMVMTNDVAIISIVPLYLFTARKYHLPIIMPATLITIAANLGSVLTPFGNPQNLFIFNHYHFAVTRFFIITGPLVAISLLLILLVTMTIQKKPFQPHSQSIQLGDQRSLMVTLGLAIIVLAGVFKLVAIPVIVVAAILVTIWIDRKILLTVDYSLLLTFACFFLIAGILSRDQFVTTVIHDLMRTPTSTYLTSIGASQLISNVPAAVLLANFTSNGTALLLGTNIGGLGTLVASLANLLALKQVVAFQRSAALPFIKTFTIVNVILLVIIGIIGWIMLII